jgi:hypothetical protein
MAVSDTDGKFMVNANIDYIVSLLHSSSLHTVTKQISGETKKECFDYEEHCSPGASTPRIVPIENVHVDGNMTEPVSFPPTVFIRK